MWAECITRLCSVSRVASASFSCLIFNDVLVSSTLTLPVNIFTWKKEKPCSPGATKWYTSEQHTYTSSEHLHLEEEETMLARGTKIFVAPGEHGFFFFQVKIFTGSVCVLLTSISLKIKKTFQFAKNVKCRRISWGWFLRDRTRRFVLMSGRNYMLLL